MRTYLALTLLIVGLPQSSAAGEAAPTEKGTVRFQLDGDQSKIPQRYQLEPHSFDYVLSLKKSITASNVDIYTLQFPSPVETKCKENNTVHAEYYRPRGKGPFPCVIVLDITGGDQSLSRTISSILAQSNVGALFVQMAYYGPRRPPGSGLRLLSTDYEHSMAAVRQTVLDLRRAAAWMEGRPEVDSKRLGILGTSLGSFMGTLTAEMEPKLRRVAVLLGGGGLVEAYYDDPRAAHVRWLWEALGGTKEKLAKLIAPADPLTCAGNLRDRRVLIIAGKRDEIVPPRMAEMLAKACGDPKVVWYDCTHYGAALYFVPAMKHIVQHFAAAE